MDYVYLCRDGENEELRYSIRSLEASLPDVKVWLVGGMPSWYTGNHIRVYQHGSKYKNARKNLNAIFRSPQISEHFVLMNDDFYVLKQMEEVPYFHSGPLENKINRYKDLNINSSYLRQLENTQKYLISMGISNPLDYELHVPMPMSKPSIRTAVTTVCLWRSFHGNVNRVGGQFMEDVKVYGERRKEKTDFDYTNPKLSFLSSEDRSFERLREEVLEDMFPHPSSVENSRILF